MVDENIIDIKKQLNSSDRVYFYDYWRAFMVITVLFHHSYLSFIIGYDWYVNDLIMTIQFTKLSQFLDVFMMPIMFFIAGYFVFPSIKKGVKRFAFKKTFRIAIPFVFGVIFLAPIMMYFYLISHFPLWEITFFDFWLNEFFTDIWLDPAHYWFLSLLFFFFIAFGAFYAAFRKRLLSINEKSRENPPSKVAIIVFLVMFLIISILLFFLVGLVFPDTTWYFVLDIKFLKLQLTRSILYLFYFILGIIVFTKKLKLPKSFLKFTPLLIVISIIATAFFGIFKFDVYLAAFVSFGFLPIAYQFINAIVHILYCFLIFMTLMAIFQAYLNRQSKVLSRIGTNSYKIYVVHLIWVVFLQYLLLEIQIFAIFKLMIIFIGAFGLSWGTSEILGLLRRGFDNVLNIKK